MYAVQNSTSVESDTAMIRRVHADVHSIAINNLVHPTGSMVSVLVL